MREAAEQFITHLDEVNFASSDLKVLSNFTSDCHQQDGSLTRDLLYKQLYRPVDWLGCMETATAFKVGIIIEFGGGIGTGTLPKEKRPNLESITKKNFRGLDQEISYYSAINTDSITQSANSLIKLIHPND